MDTSHLEKNEKGSYTLKTSGSALVDLFFKTVRKISTDQLHPLLEAAWDESPILTLKLTFYNRDCRGGKGGDRFFTTQ